MLRCLAWNAAARILVVPEFSDVTMVSLVPSGVGRVAGAEVPGRMPSQAVRVRAAASSRATVVAGRLAVGVAGTAVSEGTGGAAGWRSPLGSGRRVVRGLLAAALT